MLFLQGVGGQGGLRKEAQEKKPSQTGVVRAMAKLDQWRWVSTPRWVLTS